MSNPTQPTKQELIDHVESLVAKCAELTKERDEARKRLSEYAMDKIAELDKEMGL